MTYEEAKEAEFKKASEIAAAATSITRATYEEVRQACLNMASWKDAEFERLINVLPAPIMELIKAFSEYSKILNKNANE